MTGKWGDYYLSGQYRKNAAAGTNGGAGFAELAAAKAAGQPDVSGISFKDMWQTRFPGAYYHVMDGYQSVKDAWMETVKEVGVNGLGETKNGRTHIADMHMQQIIANYYGLLHSNDILGDSVESAIRATQKALYDFDHPLEPGKVISMEEQQARMKEREFYTVFLEKLKRL